MTAPFLRSASAAWCLAAVLLLSGCDALFGSKGDTTTEEIFEQGQTDPTLTDDVGFERPRQQIPLADVATHAS